MQWIVILLGLMLLMTAALLTMLLRRRHMEAYCRIPMPRRLLTLLRRTASLKAESLDLSALHSHALTLMEQCHHLRREIAQTPALPASPDGEPRLMELARDTADANHFNRDALLLALTQWDEQPTPMEVSAFPACVGAAQGHRLALLLRTLQADARVRLRAQRLARRLLRSRKPYALLEKAGLNSIGLAALAQSLRHQEQAEALILLDRWLCVHEITAEELAQQDAQRQLQLAEELRRCKVCISALEQLAWTDCCEQADELHALCLKDPAEVYPLMDAASRLHFRCTAEAFSRRVHMDAGAVIRHALLMCEDAEPRALERHIGYWLLDAEGCRMLRRSLPGKKGRLYAYFANDPGKLRYILLWLFGVFAGFCFLQSGEPVFMLPFFALAAGDVIRLAVNRLKNPPLPSMAQDAIPAHVRTLVVLPALLHDPHEAIRRVRQLSIASHACQQEQVEYLLLGDFPPAMTAISSLDAGIITAASSAAAALADDLPLHYIQRGRTWDGERHTYCARGGHAGAIGELCRLIVQGECADVIAYATLEPAALERRYDYVMVLTPQQNLHPGTLQRLLQTMTHPLCSRYPTERGWRGAALLSPGDAPVYAGTGLLQPDAYLEATDGMADPARDADALLGELAGHISLSSATHQPHIPASAWEPLLHEARRAWQLLRWQLPWVKTPTAVINNPLTRQSRFRLRELLRHALLPLGQFALLLWALLTQNWLLLLFALASPELKCFSPGMPWLVQALCRLSLLPARMLLPLLPLWDILRHRPAASAMTPAVETWAQGIASTLFAALGLALPGTAVPALLLSAGFACFPLAHRALEAPFTQEEGLTQDHFALLEDIAASTWRFFCACTEDQPLPPAWFQFEPGQLTAPYTTPEAIGGYLLACVCARELGYLSAEKAALRLQRCLDALRALPMPFGLPCQQYALPSLTVLDSRVSAASVGFLAAALMTAAQALRAWLPELPLPLANLSAEAEACLRAMDLSALYDGRSGFFYAGLDAQGQPTGSIRSLTDDGLLLIFAACARKLVPADCLLRLRRSCVRLGKQDVPLSRHGAATEHLLAGLFLPLNPQSALAYIQAMIRRSQEGLWGQGDCHVWRFDADLTYQQDVFGLPQVAFEPVQSSPVYAPYAAALALPFMPRAAADALARFCDQGVKGPHGLCDALDLTSGTTLIGLHDVFHQGMIFASLAHCLADTPIQRLFCSLPEVEACLPLLEFGTPSLVLPALPVRRNQPTVDAPPPVPIDRQQMPAPMQLLGNQAFRLLTDAHGRVLLMDGDISLNSAFHLYLTDEGRTYRLCDGNLPGEMHFNPGETRCEQLCGSLRSEVVHCADTLRRRSLHVVTITNLSTRDRVIELADCLLPDLAVPLNTLEAAHRNPFHLTLHARGTDRTLHHWISASIPPLADAVITDAAHFTGRGGTLAQPAALETPLHDLTAASPEPCLAFRSRYALGGRGQLTLWFTVSLEESEPPQLTELSGIRQLSALQAKAIDSTAALTVMQRHSAQLLLAPLLQSGAAVSLLADTPSPVLADLLAVFGYLKLHGVKAKLRIHCESALRSSLSEQVHGATAEEMVAWAAPNEPAFPLVFMTGTPLAEQLTALYSRMLAIDESIKPPVPAKLPEVSLQYSGPYGGFDPETQDYILQLHPGQYPPVPWTNRHRTRYFQEATDESGLRTPFHENVQLRMEDGTILSPWAVELPRAIRMRPGETDWEAWSDQLDLRLRTACLPGHRCGLRILHIHNASEHPVTLHITVTADLSGSPLVCTDGVVMTDQPTRQQQSFLAGEGWHAAAPSSAQLSCTSTLEPHHSRKLLWLSGFARHGEDIARAQATLRAHTPSELLRMNQAAWAQRLSAWAFSTPEATLDLLLNRILPVQALTADGIKGVPALAYLTPGEARRALLHQARQPMSRDEWAYFTLLAADYIRITRDENLLQVRLPALDVPLLEHCRKTLMNVPLDRQHLPLGDDQPRRCFLYALATQALDGLSPDPEAAEFSRQLLNAADTYLWQDGCYGTPLRLDVQTLACAAYGATPRTRQSIAACWASLYDEQHGLLRQRDSDDTPPLPGLPENGGMVTLEAVRAFRALLKTARLDEAFELLMALNPLHHTDTPERQARFQCAPYQLHGGMWAAPLQAGRAVPGGEEAAALLYAAILEDMLGVHLHGKVLRLAPCVPGDWDAFSFTLRIGASTWHISAERRIRLPTLDGDPLAHPELLLTDDGKVHQARFPLT